MRRDKAQGAGIGVAKNYRSRASVTGSQLGELGRVAFGGQPGDACDGDGPCNPRR